MTIAKGCVLAACAQPVLTVGLVKAASARDPGPADRNDSHQPKCGSVRQAAGRGIRTIAASGQASTHKRQAWQWSGRTT